MLEGDAHASPAAPLSMTRRKRVLSAYLNPVCPCVIAKNVNKKSGRAYPPNPGLPARYAAAPSRVPKAKTCSLSSGVHIPEAGACGALFAQKLPVFTPQGVRFAAYRRTVVTKIEKIRSIVQPAAAFSEIFSGGSDACLCRVLAE